MAKKLKIIISHDIDHLSVREHLLKDLIIPKYNFWSLLELVKGKISFGVFKEKIKELFQKDGWNNLKELLEFDKKNNLKSTFFVAVNNGKGLNYSLKQAQEAINLIKKYDFDIGVHGICYNDYKGIKEEYQTFKEISGMDNFGIRMHYLRKNQQTLKNLSKANYLFDTTEYKEDLSQEYKVERIKEIPFHIMDSFLLGPRSDLNLKKAKEKTITLLKKAESKEKKYFSVLFHQVSFSDSFPRKKEWYNWFIDYCHEKGYGFDNYKDLI